jgi:hypothetical protein
MAPATMLPSAASGRSGSLVAALLLVISASLVGIELARRRGGTVHSAAWTWRWPPLGRRLSPKGLERHVLRAVARAAMLDPAGRHLLPNHVEVLLTPAQLRSLGPFADRLAERIAHGMVVLTRRRRCRLAADPDVVFAVAPGSPRGRPAVRATFGRPTTTLDAGAATRPRPASAPADLNAVLRRLEPPGRPVLLGSRQVRLGRRPECDLPVLDPAVSRRHASLYRRAGGWYLVDHGSTNGTFVNGRRVRGPARLANGDEIQLGRRVRLRFEHRRLRSA